MTTRTIRIRTARPADAEHVAAIHDESWSEAYRGIIPGAHLDRMIQRRGPAWWRNAIAKGSRIAVIDYDGVPIGYASYGRNRAPSLPYWGEIFEIYLKPEFQGLGFGSRLFAATRRELASHGQASMVVWSLAENERAVRFYEKLGGLLVGRAHERFDEVSCERLAFGWR